MALRWLMTIREAGYPSPRLANRPPGIEFDLSPRWISRDPQVGDAEPPNPNCLSTLRRWPTVVEIRRPDGTRTSAELYAFSMHLHFFHNIRFERDAAGRMRNPWRQCAVLRGVSAAELPAGSEVWGEVDDA